MSKTGFPNQTHFKGVLKAQFWPMEPAKYYIQKEPKAYVLTVYCSKKCFNFKCSLLIHGHNIEIRSRKVMEGQLRSNVIKYDQMRSNRIK